MVELTLVAQVVATLAGGALLALGYRIDTGYGKPAARSFAVLAGILGVTALCAGATAHTGTAYKLVWLYTSLAIPLALAFFAFDYYGIDEFTSRSRVGVAVTPAVTGALGGTLVVLGTPAVSGGSTPPLAALATLPPVVFDLAATLRRAGLYYTTAVTILAVGLVFRTVSRYEHLDARLGPAVLFVGVWPWLANLFVPQLTSAVTFGVGVATVAAGYTASAVVAWLAVGRFRLLESSPMAGTVGPALVLDSMDDAVLFVDEDRRVLGLNAVACATFGTTESEAVGGPVAAVVDLPLDEGPTDDPVSVETTDGVRQFAVTRSAVTDRTGDENGSVVVMRDVTERRTREQRLDVFNRILRHNLRNDATTIIGQAQLVSDGGNPTDRADTIIDTTTGLVDMAERAREIDQLLTASSDDETTPVRSVVEDVVEGVGSDHPEVAVTTAVPDDATAAAPTDVFRIVVRNLVENAAEHNDADEPYVVVSADFVDDGSLAVSVADNGPGIPEHERAVVEAGEENPLQHGSGIGLWSVYMGVTQFGGAVDFARNTPRGSVVTVTVPVADQAPPAGEDDPGEQSTSAVVG